MKLDCALYSKKIGNRSVSSIVNGVLRLFGLVWIGTISLCSFKIVSTRIDLYSKFVGKV